MNRLQKRVWIELAATGLMVALIIIPGILRLAHRNAQGIVYVFIIFLVGVPAGIIMYYFQAKQLKKYDEREKAMMRKAYSVSTYVFVSYLVIFSLSMFFLVGGGGNIPVIWVPMMLFTGVFLAQCAQSAIVLIQCAKDDNE